MGIKANPQIDYWVEHAKREIKDTYGDVVDVKPKSLLKFGQRDDVGTSKVLIWNHSEGNEVLPTDNTITHYSSSSGSDTGAGKIEGHTIDANGDFTFVVQDLVLAGQTKTALTTPLARSSRAFNTTATDWVGDLYIYEDVAVTAGVPQTASAVHVKVAAGENQTAKTATTFSKDDYYLLSNFYASVGERTSAQVDFFLEIALKGQVFRPRFIKSAASTGSFINQDFRPFLIVPPNADIRVRGLASTTNVAVDAGFNGLLCQIQKDI